MNLVNRIHLIICVLVVCAAWADIDIVTLSIDSLPTPMPESIIINYTGAALSAFIPGAGQFYQRRYVMGGFFLAAEATTLGMSIYWLGRADDHDAETGRLRRMALLASDSAAVFTEDSAARAYYLDRSGLYTVWADRAKYEARQAKYTAYGMFSWAAGAHLYGFLDALEVGGVRTRGEERSPKTAGFLAAVPFLGLGQLYNGRPGKAGMMAMTQVSLAVMAYGHHQLMNMASDRYNEMRDSTSVQYAHRTEHLNYWRSRYDSEFSRRNTFLWVALFSYLYSIFDAVVDAHLSDFDEKVRLGADLAVGVDVIKADLTYRF